MGLRFVDPFNQGRFKVRVGDDNLVQITERQFGVRGTFLYLPVQFWSDSEDQDSAARAAATGCWLPFRLIIAGTVKRSPRNFGGFFLPHAFQVPLTCLSSTGYDGCTSPVAGAGAVSQSPCNHPPKIGSRSHGNLEGTDHRDEGRGTDHASPPRTNPVRASSRPRSELRQPSSHELLLVVVRRPRRSPLLRPDLRSKERSKVREAYASPVTSRATCM